jgi:hypothetical protein
LPTPSLRFILGSAVEPLPQLPWCAFLRGLGKVRLVNQYCSGAFSNEGWKLKQASWFAPSSFVGEFPVNESLY